MPRVTAVVLALALGVLAATGADGVARQTPPHRAKHHTVRHKHKKRRHRAKLVKPGRIPAVTTPVQSITAPSTTTTTDTPADQGTDSEPATTTTTTATTTTTTTPVAPLSHTLGVTEKEYSLGLSRTTLGAGVVTIQVHNLGEDPHDLRLDSADGTLVNQWAELSSLQLAPSQALTLPPGTYRLYCTLPHHAELGMDKQITVAAG